MVPAHMLGYVETGERREKHYFCTIVQFYIQGL